MTLIDKIRRLRLIERILVASILLLTALGVWLFLTGVLSGIWWYGFLGLVGIFIIILFVVAMQLDGKMALIATQANYTVSDEFATLYERSPTAYFTIDSRGLIVNFNQAAVKLLETMSTDMHRTNFFSLLSSSTEGDSSIIESKVRAGLMLNEVEVAMYTAQGREIWVLMTVSTDRANDQRLISLVDITQAKKVDTAKSEFVALATHQLRTPIAAIRWNVELLKKNLQDDLTPDRERYLEKVERNIIRMIALINDFLSVSKLEMGTYAAQIEILDMTAFFDSVLDEFDEKIAQKNITLERNDSPPNTTIKTDSRLIHIIVSNLLSNAVKYLQPEGKLTLTYTAENGHVTIVVADNGIGIPSEELEKLFTKFYRATNAQRHQTEGTGLGLYIVQQSVEQLGGTIKVESEEDQGAKFIVTLPMKI